MFLIPYSEAFTVKATPSTAMSVSAESQATIKSTIDAVTSKGSIPGIVFVAVDKNGDLVTSHCSGKTGAAQSTPMSLDSVFWIASCTKIITGIACMQLVEQGKINLEDSAALYKIVPELKDKKVLQDDGSLVSKKKEITLRMLLDHTAGFGYTFFNPKLRDWSRPLGFDEFSGDARDILDAPLVNQPGETWEYGVRMTLLHVPSSVLTSFTRPTSTGLASRSSASQA